jgi:hypothetical protein
MKKLSPRQIAKQTRKIAIKKGDLTYEGTPCKKGHTKKYTSNSNCVECKEFYMKEYRDDNEQYIKEYGKEYRIIHKEETKKFRDDNPEIISARQKIYKSKSEFKKRRNERERERRQEDPVYRTKGLLVSSLWGFCNLRGSKKEGRTHELLDYTAKEHNDYIETLFQGPSEDHPEGMTWKNRSEWAVDHIIPQSHFTSIDQLRECFALSNLKPEWKDWNIWKNDRFVGSSEEFPMPTKAA